MASVSDFISEDSGVFSRSVSGFLPRTAFVPFSQGKERLTSLVKVGDRVHEGQTIAQGKDASVQASIPGVVEGIAVMQFPDGKQGSAAKIALGGSFSYVGKRHGKIDWRTYDAATIQLLLAEKGVVNTFFACESLTAQIKHLSHSCARILTVRLFDDDPSRVTERFVFSQCEQEIREGVAIIARAMGARGVVFAYDEHTQHAPADADTVLFSVPVLSCALHAEKYPAGFMHELVAAIKKMTAEEPFAAVGNRDVYIDVPTALAAYNAIALSTPLMERFVHVTGECLNAAAIMKVKIGTTLGELALQCGGFKRPVAKIVINGIVCGQSVSSLSIPVTKMVKSVTFLPARKARRQYDEPCIRCGQCRKVCPVGLYPDLLYRSFLHGTDAGALEKNYMETSILCTECGLCNAVCPSRLPLSKTVALLAAKKGAVHEE